MGKQVVAFEPMAENLRGLYRNLSENSWNDVEVWPLGLSDAPGLVTIYGYGTGASLVPEWAGSSTAFSRSISVSTLDILLDYRFKGERMFVKIDVEGAELRVLKGAKRVLQRTPKPAWLVEITLTENRSSCNPQFTEIFEQFWTNGYEVFTADAARRKITKTDVKKWVASGKVDFGTYNYLSV
ncbi:MAG: FkbM family methyltransferase [Anaerolineales bacterium]|nr:FkbM family methyltransferase [Anaerolineales bacterium]